MRQTQLLILILLVSSFSYGQLVSEKIGYMINDSIYESKPDSILTFVNRYNEKQILLSELRITLDNNGNVSDSAYCELDSGDNVLFFTDYITSNRFKYDKHGTCIGHEHYGINDTIKVTYEANYNDEGILISKLQDGVEYLYTYKGDTIIETLELENTTQGRLKVTTKTKYNKFHKIIYKNTIRLMGSEKKVETVINEYSDKGNWLTHMKYINGKKVKETTHHFKNGLEEYQIEKYFKPEYEIKTNFIYEYY